MSDNPVMLAASKIPDPKTIKWPKLGSPKLDGIRCHTTKDIYSRNNILIPNLHIRKLMKDLTYYQLDGELMIDTGTEDFNDVQSGVMSVQGTPKFTFNVFDCIQTAAPFRARWALYLEAISEIKETHPFVRAVEQKWLHNEMELERYMNECLDDGYEGVILKDPEAKYKFGRSTLKQQTMLKYKQFDDDEAVIIGFKELMHNLDTSCKKQENMVGGNTLGAFLVRWKGIEFEIGGGEGMTTALRKLLWANRESLLGKLITFKYQGVSKYGVPRFPTYKVIRDARV